MDKMIVTSGPPKIDIPILYPGFFCDQKGIYYCKGFKSDKELRRFLSYEDIGCTRVVCDPMNSKNDSSDFIHSSSVTHSGYILRCRDFYYIIERDFHRHSEELVKETRRSILIMETASSKMSFTDTDLDIISCNSFRPIERENMIIFLSNSKSPESLIKELLSFKDDPLTTHYTFLFNDISLLKYMRVLCGKYLSSEPFLHRCCLFTKVHDDDTIYEVTVDGNEENSTIELNTLSKELHRLPCIPIDF